MSDRVYRGPQIAADVCNVFFSAARATAEILDVGAGTGLVGERLRQHGFARVDGLEPSAEMIAIARHKQIYRDLYQEAIAANKTTSLAEGLALVFYCEV